ncbi:unnamed protein product [Paramecium octaurelia]|uniref:Uncharacterized protein n=1 Tax=Paramecium octaurelia TaxID=43137 RepID=A0A8S1UXU3_PAROT|nr:unnamed protein product [Paramecium octaurelia]
MQNQYGWNLLKNSFYINIKADTSKISLIDLPPQTRKVKLHIYLQSGTCQTDGKVTWTLSTKVDIIKIKMQPYGQDALSLYSENCSITLDETKIIQISRSGNFPSSQNFSLEAEVLAYK